MTPTPLSHRTGPYIPRSHEKFRRWAFVFTRRIAQDPAAAGLDEAIAAELTAMFEEYNAAYDLAVAPSTRTRVTISRRNAARKLLESMCRTYAQRIKKNDEVSDEIKCELHLHLGRKPRKAIRAVDSRPLLSIPSAGAGLHVLRWIDSAMGHALRKPKDAAALQLFAVVAHGPVPAVDEARYVGTYTRQPIRVTWPSETAGKTITYFGRWITRAGKEGPWSLPMAMQIAFGGPVLATIERHRPETMNVKPIKHAA